MMRAGISGPFFVTIGDAEKLNSFLNSNPKVPRSNIYADDYSFKAYKAVGFKSVTDPEQQEKAKEAKLTPPNLDFGQWMAYLGNVGKLSPVPKDLKFGEFPEGVLRLGGTFVVNGEDVLYQWSDRIPGDHPDMDAVLAIAKQATKKDAAQ
eukprot:gnl/MRDRNA2_/MRDRNA2_123408_c0_seq1.p1 gnl/MRDRNA2_/MRDRNA2_123408_c0~~gnl/MRDRNA2_/MRDRNA2_123408_c0_seq1.p1  ORF type:complete len:150 (+),score=37.61 gnl/MRDRNA2_/MRDRNA2_123408_c0_seq1:701-1150(+)